jgi:FtsH-binding integral membrane protein
MGKEGKLPNPVVRRAARAGSVALGVFLGFVLLDANPLGAIWQAFVIALIAFLALFLLETYFENRRDSV